MTEDTCELRSLEQVLCPSGCRCSNAIPVAANTKHGEPSGAESKVLVVNGEGVSESMLGVVATGVIEEGEIMTSQHRVTMGGAWRPSALAVEFRTL